MGMYAGDNLSPSHLGEKIICLEHFTFIGLNGHPENLIPGHGPPHISRLCSANQNPPPDTSFYQWVHVFLILQVLEAVNYITHSEYCTSRVTIEKENDVLVRVWTPLQSDDSTKFNYNN